ncbi:hypothetical protein PISMIDRAFT_10955 [Pisolithus microcarpus 441]|uniref:Unplaced genomic scaffold scaffold_43, whole genome shotgun sequence n=1 Tax=Pisolithus microcarpus 441 TaxID=765257 RepID=A0A0C9Z2P9_9AGAM|nr:hypothetical protein PISMIDRAFT_10955 [Pisolithus microcarpus 441]
MVQASKPNRGNTTKEQLEEPDEEKMVNGNCEHKETSDHKEGSQYDEGSLIKEYKVYLEVDDDNEPITYFGVMHEEDESTTSEEKKSAALNQGVTPWKWMKKIHTRMNLKKKDGNGLGYTVQCTKEHATNVNIESTM